MIILDLVQGSEKWNTERVSCFCASEAAAMQNESKFMTRNELLDLKKGWKPRPLTSFTKRLFAKGHEHEDQAREILENEEFEDYPPLVGAVEVSTRDITARLLASFDGISGQPGKYHLWEHKDWNEILADNIRNKVIEPHYYWQLEHQMLVADANEITFMCSDGTVNKMVSMIYKSVKERRLQLIDGWEQFSKDLKTHQLTATQEKMTPNESHFPVLYCEMEGTKIVTNFTDCITTLREIADVENNIVPETDQQFVDKDAMTKNVKKLRKLLAERVIDVEAEFVTFSAFNATAKELDTLLQGMQSNGERMVKQGKDAKKQAIKNIAINQINEHIDACNKRKEPGFNIRDIIEINPDWAGAMRNKRTTESLQNSLDSLVSEWKITISNAVKSATENNIDPDFDISVATNTNDVSQRDRKTEEINTQAHHNPLPGDFILWSRTHKINSIAFFEMEKLINKYFLKR